MQGMKRSIGNKRNRLGNNFGYSENDLGDHEYEWYNINRRKPMVGYMLDEDGNYPEDWRWF